MRTLMPLVLTACLVPDAMVDAYLDRDGDGARTVAAGGTDCDDADPGIHPGALEVCGNGVDDDCDGVVDDRGVGAITFYEDGDDDGWGDANAPVVVCARRAGLAPEPGDCDDDDRTIHPGADEDCANGVDDDCDGTIDRDGAPAAWFPDTDGDGYGNGDAQKVSSCTELPGYSRSPTDCDDTDPATFPGAMEVPYDGRDNACDGVAEEFDLDGDGFLVDPRYAVPGILDASWVPPTGAALDCDDRRSDIHPGARDEPYDGEDRDCDGGDDYDADRDGHRAIGYGGDDCDDLDPDRHPGRPEIHYDDVDDDCDPRNDNDADLDGRPGMLAGGTDCDDHDPNNWSRCATCADKDGDNAFRGCDAYVTLTEDCDDGNADVWFACHTCADHDQDGRYDGCDAYVVHDEDCDDGDPDVWARCDTCSDADGDGLRDGCDAYLTAPRDCDDALANAWVSCGTCADLDHDGWGAGTCDAPPDCDDTDPDVSSLCATCVDADGDGSRTGCDRHVLTPYDCDDTDPEVGGHVFEILDDGLDQDCNGRDLTVSDRDGIFVSPTGEDTPVCGSQASPCATPAYAEPKAYAEGKVLFLATGSYAGFGTRVSVFGGRTEPTWTTMVHTSHLRTSSDSSVLELNGPMLQVAGLRIEKSSNESQAIVVSGRVASLSITDSRISDIGTHDRCVLLSSQAGRLRLERVEMDGCASSSKSTGVLWSSDPEASSFTARDVVASVGDSSSCRVFDLSGARADVSHSRLSSSSSELCIGLLADVTNSIELASTEIEVGTSALVERATGLEIRSPLASLASTIVHAEGAFDARGVVLISPSPSTWTFGSVAIGASATGTATALSTTGDGTFVGRFVSLGTRYAADSAAIVTPSGVHADIFASVLSSDGNVAALQGPFSFRSSLFHGTCLVSETMVGGPCRATNVEQLNGCADTACESATGNIESGNPFREGTSSWLELASTSLAIDALPVVEGALAPLEDAASMPRPKGAGWDLGALERQ
ncbi:MAG: putative metal-binding motif-containing protein [Alphaproteobacteria bacterium]|nr:putative metal-binding motif-containing protein [Alphaproteobacteria bacterium]